MHPTGREYLATFCSTARSNRLPPVLKLAMKGIRVYTNIQGSVTFHPASEEEGEFSTIKYYTYTQYTFTYINIALFDLYFTYVGLDRLFPQNFRRIRKT